MSALVFNRFGDLDGHTAADERTANGVFEARWEERLLLAEAVLGTKNLAAGQTACNLPDQSTTLWVEPTSIGDSRVRGALRDAG